MSQVENGCERDRSQGTAEEERRGAPLLEVGEIRVSDPWCHEQALQPWELLARPLAGGEHSFRMRYLKGPHLTVYREHYGSDVELVGMPPPDVLAFAIPLRLHEQSRFWRSPLSAPGFPGLLNSGVDVRFAAGHDHIVLLVDRPWLGRNLCPEIVAGIDTCIAHRFLPAAPEGSAHLGALLSRVIDGFWCDTQTSGAKLSTPAVVRALAQDFLLGLAAALRVRSPQTTKPPAWLRQKALRRALDWLRATEPGAFSIGELCQVAGASQRTLEYAFRDAYQMTPAAFLQRWRLRSVRTALLAASPAVASVTEIALDAGFYELGRFAGAYRRLFGERPSETLRRPSPPIPGNLAWT